MLPEISSEGIGVAPPANEFSVATSGGELLYGTISAHLLLCAEFKPHDEYREST